MDPLDAMIFESRTKLREMYSDDSKSLKRRRKLSSSEMSSLESVDRLLSDYRDVGVAAEVEETRERNKRSFPDTTTIDPYDPTTYGYIELGKCLCIICLFRQSTFDSFDNHTSHLATNQKEQSSEPTESTAS
jgi:hypothetical protein